MHSDVNGRETCHESGIVSCTVVGPIHDSVSIIVNDRIQFIKDGKLTFAFSALIKLLRTAERNFNLQLKKVSSYILQ